jgi:hypothetical protein
VTGEQARRALDARPADIAEWEDLLVRLELGPLALRSTLETVPAGDAGVRAQLAALLVTEQWAVEAIGALRDGRRVSARPAPDAVPADADGLDADSLSHRYAALRRKNFAQVQRRGLEVWDWRSERAEGGMISVFGLLALLIDEDVRALAAIRARRSGGGAPC